jgi:hypothetical protein
MHIGHTHESRDKENQQFSLAQVSYFRTALPTSYSAVILRIISVLQGTRYVSGLYPGCRHHELVLLMPSPLTLHGAYKNVRYFK